MKIDLSAFLSPDDNEDTAAAPGPELTYAEIQLKILEMAVEEIAGPATLLYTCPPKRAVPAPEMLQQGGCFLGATALCDYRDDRWRMGERPVWRWP